MVWRGDSSGRVAKSLLTLFDQVDAAHPDRDKSSDGTIGNAAHQATKSEHNKDKDGVVRALDITNDPAHGVSSRLLAESLVASRDPRILYIISNGQMNRSYKKDNILPWTWAAYHGPNAHFHHVHISVVSDPALYDNVHPWAVAALVAENMEQGGVDGPVGSPTPLPPLPGGHTAQRLLMAKAIMNFEARRDRDGHLMVYQLPANDGGGRYEVAGINEKYDKDMVDKLADMLHESKFDEAELAAEEYIAGNTDPAAALTNIPQIESYLRDCVFNRGARGATKILQMALKVEADGSFGPLSKAAMKMAEADTHALLVALRAAREKYERVVVGVRPNLWKGLVNRWNNALLVAQKFPDAPDVPALIPAPAPAVTV